MSDFPRLSTPIGRLQLCIEAAAITAIRFEDKGTTHPTSPSSTANRMVYEAACQQLEEYFARRRQRFDLPLAPQGSEFEQQAWRALLDIPFGETRSYKQQAEKIGRPQAVRAIGRANGKNPIPILIPCHRVIGSDGSLTGYAGGIAIKRLLLELEGTRSLSLPL